MTVTGPRVGGQWDQGDRYVSVPGPLSQGDVPRDHQATATIRGGNPGQTPYARGNQIQLQQNHTVSQAGHEVGHEFGADDQYMGGRRLDGSVLDRNASPDSNVMRNYAPRANPQTLREILMRNLPWNTYRCAPGVEAPGGQCGPGRQ